MICACQWPVIGTPLANDIWFLNFVSRTRDELQCGPAYKNEEKMFPDFFLSVKGHAIAIMEAKAPNRSLLSYKEDRRKLLDEMKCRVLWQHSSRFLNRFCDRLPSCRENERPVGRGEGP